MRLVGLEEPGPPLRVVLVEETEDLARAVPPWISGFARSGDSLVVIFPARVPSYPDSTLEGVLLHEVAHVLIGRAAGHQPVPRWMNEGLAMIAGSPWDLGDRSRLTLALFRGQPPSLAALDRRFAGSAGEARGAYALAGAFTQDLLRRNGSDSTAKILRGLADGLTFRAAFRRATGQSPEEAEDSFWGRYTFWYRWMPILTSSATLWIGITALSLLAIRRRRQRDRQILQDWDAQEARIDRPEDESIN